MNQLLHHIVIISFVTRSTKRENGHDLYLSMSSLNQPHITNMCKQKLNPYLRM